MQTLVPSEQLSGAPKESLRPSELSEFWTRVETPQPPTATALARFAHDFTGLTCFFLLEYGRVFSFNEATASNTLLVSHLKCHHATKAESNGTMQFSSRSGLAAVGRCHGHRYTDVLARDGLTSAGATWLGSRFWQITLSTWLLWTGSFIGAVAPLLGPGRSLFFHLDLNSGRTLLRFTTNWPCKSLNRAKWRCKKSVNDLTPASSTLNPAKFSHWTLEVSQQPWFST